MQANTDYIRYLPTRIYTDSRWFWENIEMVRAFAPYPFSDKDLRRFGVFDNCRESSTNRGFLCKTKPICRRCRIKITSVFIKGYEEKARVASISKQSQTKPIKAKANVKMGKPYFSPWRSRQARLQRPNFNSRYQSCKRPLILAMRTSQRGWDER
jgi:hypothetical protein